MGQILLPIYLLTFFLVSFNNVQGASIVSRPGTSDFCNSPIYCKGDLLKTVQLARIFHDSKTFVDLYQRNDPAVTLANFNKMMAQSGNKPNKTQVSDFVSQNFDKTNEILTWTPPDWNPNPPILKQIADKNFREWLFQLNSIWKNLSRQMSPDIAKHPDRYSFIPVEHGFIIPGGRFEEFYYWDSYWVIEGLLLSGMHETTKGILLNFLSMIQRFGFIPNGGRIYYLMRSQPPLLISMIEKYVEATGDSQFLYDNMLTLEKEFAFFQREKTVDVTRNNKTYRMARYIITSEGPRPESYREDYEEGQKLRKGVDLQTFYEDLKAGAESGWDFSGRWFIPDGPGVGNLTDISTRNIIPVDLNAFLQRNARLLSEYNHRLGNTVKAKKYKNIAMSYQKAIDEVLWSEEEGTWLDYDMKNGRPRKKFYPTNLTPLYTKSFDLTKSSVYAKKTVDYLKANHIDTYKGGIPTSLENTGQQWDAPNAWPPLQSIIVQGLLNTNTEPALGMAKDLATMWTRANYLGFEQYGDMFEKYDSGRPGEYGGGGEYVVQQGFGWTNGVIYEFLNIYPNMTSRDPKFNGSN